MRRQQVEDRRSGDVRRYETLISGTLVDDLSGETFDQQRPYNASCRTLSFGTPFGGYETSGTGRVSCLEFFEEYARVRSVWVGLSGQTGDYCGLG